MGLTIQLELKDDQIKEMEDRLFERLRKADPNYGKRTKPYTPKEASEVLPWSRKTIYHKIKAKVIRLNDAGLIPASEIERLTK